MQDLRETFQTAFGISIDELPLPKCELHSLARSTPPAKLVYASPIVADRWFATQEDPFLSQAPQGYFTIGFWGHGINSYAFYYQRADGAHRVAFRLPFEGLYMDDRKSASQIANFLSCYFTFERRLLERSCQVRAWEFLGEGRYEFEPAGKPVQSFNVSMLEIPDFETRFESVLQAL